MTPFAWTLIQKLYRSAAPDRDAESMSGRGHVSWVPAVPANVCGRRMEAKKGMPKNRRQIGVLLAGARCDLALIVRSSRVATADVLLLL